MSEWHEIREVIVRNVSCFHLPAYFGNCFTRFRWNSISVTFSNTIKHVTNFIWSPNNSWHSLRESLCTIFIITRFKRNDESHISGLDFFFFFFREIYPNRFSIFVEIHRLHPIATHTKIITFLGRHLERSRKGRGNWTLRLDFERNKIAIVRNSAFPKYFFTTWSIER